MLGFKLLRETELQAIQALNDTRLASLQSQLDAAQAYARKCESLLDHERERIDSERERADRIADSLFQSQGLPATSSTVIAEQAVISAESKLKQEDYLAQLQEIYSETENDMIEEGDEPIIEAVMETTRKS
ncbi:MAG: hypothetical protein WA182_06800 [Candidatus Sulfotelmatobacter sp.]